MEQEHDKSKLRSKRPDKALYIPRARRHARVEQQTDSGPRQEGGNTPVDRKALANTAGAAEKNEASAALKVFSCNDLGVPHEQMHAEANVPQPEESKEEPGNQDSERRLNLDKRKQAVTSVRERRSGEGNRLESKHLKERKTSQQKCRAGLNSSKLHSREKEPVHKEAMSEKFNNIDVAKNCLLEFTSSIAESNGEATKSSYTEIQAHAQQILPDTSNEQSEHRNNGRLNNVDSIAREHEIDVNKSLPPDATSLLNRSCGSENFPKLNELVSFKLASCERSDAVRHTVSDCSEGVNEAQQMEGSSGQDAHTEASEVNSSYKTFTEVNDATEHETRIDNDSLSHRTESASLKENNVTLPTTSSGSAVCLDSLSSNFVALSVMQGLQQGTEEVRPLKDNSNITMDLTGSEPVDTEADAEIGAVLQSVDQISLDSAQLTTGAEEPECVERPIPEDPEDDSWDALFNDDGDCLDPHLLEE
uniref:coiled-coil domain-containing protein R3HCC1L-like n=1 Tax=Pristiophorus japonicus TaxID=55135 RepID=UPI00398EA50C